MIPMTAGDVAALTGGRLDQLAAQTRVTGPVVIDSRLCSAGSVFVCLPGEHTDGHQHAGDAFRRGAALVLAARPVDGPAVVVDDPVRALGFLAGGVLRRTTNCRVVGVTGSSGKTSTKDLMAAVLSRAGATVAAAASLNNEIGLPLTVLEVEESTRYLVLEYSARGVGHIAYLCGIARPARAVVLNVGSAHLGEFGSQAAIAAAKGELVDALALDGLAVLNVDDPLVAAMRSRTGAKVVGYGRSETADVRIEGLTLTSQAQPRFTLTTAEGSERVRLAVSGAHQAMNAAAVAAVGLSEGLSLAEIADALAEVTEVSAHRMRLLTRADGLLIVDDAYNANPESMRAGLDALDALARERGGGTWAVLGEMRELGDASSDLHVELGRYAASLGIEHLVLVGDGARPIAAGARSVPEWVGTAEVVPSPDLAALLLEAAVGGSDTVLVKASNAVALWEVADRLQTSERGTGPAVGAGA